MPDYRVIPSIEQLRRRDGVRRLEREFGRGAILAALREVTSAFRDTLAAGDQRHLAASARDQASVGDLLEGLLRKRLGLLGRPSLRPVVNATGVIVHTNLGRAPLAPVAVERITALAGGYTNLEYDLDSGRRGGRDVHAESLLCQLLGVEAAVVVNNNAAGVLLMLAALADGREVVVSRGELVEIGGGFRVPDVMAQSGARLREVGTTNKTRVGDYSAAIGPDTALLLRVHRSNFRIEGFTEQPALEELSALGRAHHVPVAEDLGSGHVGLPGEAGEAALERILAGEPRVQDSVAAGVDVICFSGDKLLGGPQAGIIVGRKDLLARVRRHPLMRALRVDKLTYAALEATLGEYLAGRASRTVPILEMILASEEDLAKRADALKARVEQGLAAGPRVAGLRLEVVPGASTVGGGTTPGLDIPTRLLSVRLEHRGPDAIDACLRGEDPPVIGRIENDRFLLDLRTILPAEDAVLARALVRLAAGGSEDAAD